MENSQLTGSNVVLVFDDKSNFNFQDGSQISLSGREGKTPFAGFVIATTRRNTQTFSISSDSARQHAGDHLHPQRHAGRLRRPTTRWPTSRPGPWWWPRRSPWPAARTW